MVNMDAANYKRYIKIKRKHATMIKNNNYKTNRVRYIGFSRVKENMRTKIKTLRKIL